MRFADLQDEPGQRRLPQPEGNLPFQHAAAQGHRISGIEAVALARDDKNKPPAFGM